MSATEVSPRNIYFSAIRPHQHNECSCGNPGFITLEGRDCPTCYGETVLCDTCFLELAAQAAAIATHFDKKEVNPT